MYNKIPEFNFKTGIFHNKLNSPNFVHVYLINIYMGFTPTINRLG